VKEHGRFVRNSIAVLVVAGLPVLFPGPARADIESLKLAKYRGRVDRAVSRALKFLERDQATNPARDGSFTGGQGRTNGVVGLAGMAFLSKGHVPGRGPYGHAINRCIDYVLATPAQNGYLGVRGGRMYGQGIATLFLSEVSGMVDPARQQRIDKMLPKALKVILDAQKVPKDARNAGGWRYEPAARDSDLSVSGWSLMALRSARLNGAPVPVAAIRNAIKYVDQCRHPASGGFGYQPGSTTPAMAAVGLLCRELSGHHNDDVNRKCGDYLLRVRSSVFSGGHVEYGTYYASQAMFQLGGRHWEEFAESMYKYLLPKQQATGSWRHGSHGAAYRTAMYTLALTVSYRQLPIYQR